MTSRMGFWGMGSTETIPAVSTPPTTADTKPPLPPRRHTETPSTPTTPPTPPVRRRVPPPPQLAVVETPPTPGPTENGEAEKPIVDVTDSAPEVAAEPDGIETTAETQEVKEVIPEGDDVVVKLEPLNESEDSTADETTPEEAPLELKTEEADAEKPTVNGDHPDTPPQTAVTESPTTPMSAPPPPIPRRAAARTRTAPGTPTKDTSDGSPTPLPASSPTKETASDPAALELTPPRVTSDAENDDFLSAPSSPKEKPTSEEQDVPPLYVPAPDVKEEDEKPNVNGVSEHIPEISLVPQTVGEKSRAAPPMLPPRRAAPPKIEDMPAPASPIILPAEVGFTNDASWEEKAWRELVRLREDMFLARIGAVRADVASLMGTV